MRKIYGLMLVFAVILLADCASRKKTTYNIPPDIQGGKKVALMESLEEGKRLYKLHCAECHGIFKKGKDGLPNFTDQQIDMYTAYAIKRDPKNHAVAAHMDANQLHEVFMFLKLRKIKDPKPQNGTHATK